MELAHYVFQTKQEAMFAQELELDFEYTNLIGEHIDFFKNKERRALLKELLGKEDSFQALRYKMLAVVFNTDNVSLLSFMTKFDLEKIGFIFQSVNLIPVLNVFENIEFPLLLGKNRLGKEEKREWIDFLIEEVGLSDWRKHRPNELSGGQRQRVAIARALVTKPRIVLADEPTANLDSATGEAIIELMKKINRELDTTFIFSTHDFRVMEMADRVVNISDGRLAGTGKEETGHG